jgi:hypothetical protein
MPERFEWIDAEEFFQPSGEREVGEEVMMECFIAHVATERSDIVDSDESEGHDFVDPEISAEQALAEVSKVETTKLSRSFLSSGCSCHAGYCIQAESVHAGT